jgi:hypothetical protein
MTDTQKNYFSDRDSIENNENTLGKVVVGLRIKKCVISPTKYGI